MRERLPSVLNRPWGYIVAVALAIVIAAVAHHTASPAQADEGWTIDSFHSEIDVQPDGALAITETIGVDFGSLQKHGIFREIPIEYDYDAEHNRIYQFTALGVTDGAGAASPYEQSRNGANVQLKIGDPDKTVSGKQTYVISYRIEGALNAFADHDELYWNVNGPDWPVPTTLASATVRIPGGVYPQIACFAGPPGSTSACDQAVVSDQGEGALFTTRGLASGDQLTVVVSIPKGAVAEPQVLLVDKPENWFEQNFHVSVPIVVAAVVMLLGGLVALIIGWWRYGRDRVYTSIYYLSENPEEHTRPLFYRDQVVVEYTPPDDLRPAQMGLLLDERSDTKDVTATIVDLAVRGFLKIEEKDKAWVFSKKDWHLTRLKDSAGLQPCEQTILDGLFETGSEVDVSALKTKYADSLHEAEREVYSDAVGRGWFRVRPDWTRNLWHGAGIAIVAVGVGIGFALGHWLGWALLAVPVVVTGVLLLVTARLMPRRTAKGSEALRRVLGFRLYIDTAEKDRQKFNEQANIFAAYLPYAIVFGSRAEVGERVPGHRYGTGDAGVVLGLGSVLGAGVLGQHVELLVVGLERHRQHAGEQRIERLQRRRGRRWWWRRRWRELVEARASVALRATIGRLRHRGDADAHRDGRAVRAQEARDGAAVVVRRHVGDALADAGGDLAAHGQLAALGGQHDLVLVADAQRRRVGRVDLDELLAVQLVGVGRVDRRAFEAGEQRAARRQQQLALRRPTALGALDRLRLELRRQSRRRAPCPRASSASAKRSYPGTVAAISSVTASGCAYVHVPAPFDRVRQVRQRQRAPAARRRARRRRRAGGSTRRSAFV